MGVRRRFDLHDAGLDKLVEVRARQLLKSSLKNWTEG
jgi:hypothetical protein